MLSGHMVAPVMSPNLPFNSLSYLGPLWAYSRSNNQGCPMTANGTLKTYNVQNALVNLSPCRINIYIRIFKLELTVTGLTKQY
jgi:hypothetical protein